MKQLFKLFLILIWLCCAQVLFAQLPLLSQNQNAYSLLNPAVLSGNFLRYEASVEASSFYRYQWTGVEGAPRTFSLNGNYFNETHNILTGVSLIKDQTGALSHLGSYVRAGYLIRFSGHSFLTFGINAGFLQYSVDGEQLKFNDPADKVNVSLSRISPDFAFGATYYYQTSSKDYYFLGLSVPRTFGFDLQLRNDQNGIDIQRVQHYYALLGSAFSLADNSWFEWSSWIKYTGDSPVHADLNLRLELKQMLRLGLGGSSEGTAHVELGTFINLGKQEFLQVGYGYEHLLQKYGPGFGGGHEISLSYFY